MFIHQTGAKRGFFLLLVISLLSAHTLIPQSPIRAMPASAPANQPSFPDPPHRDTDVPTVSVQGKVTDAMGSPAASLRVRLMLPDGTIAQETFTDADGHYAFAPEETARYQLWVLNAAGRPLTWEGDQIFAATDDATPIHHEIHLHASLVFPPPAVEDTQSSGPLADAPILAAPASNAMTATTESMIGRIQGIITAADTGDPLRFVPITAYDADGDFVSSGFSNSAGEYSLGIRDAGSYRIGFFPANSSNNKTYHNEYYNDQPTLESADVVVVAADETITDVDATLGLAAIISGTVTTADGNRPMDNLRINLYTPNEQLIAKETTDAAGRYRFAGLAPGQYKLLFTTQNNSAWANYISEYFDNQPDFATADTITLATADRRIINAELVRSGRLVGTVTDITNGTQLAGIKVSVYSEEALVVAGVTTSESGLYTVTGLATGAYRLRFAPPSFGATSTYLAAYHNQKSTLAAADTVAVTVGTDITVDAQLTLGGQITGQMTDQATAAPIAGIHAEAYDRYGVLQASATTAADGSYTLTGLASGNYWLYFDAPDSGPAARYGNQHHLDAVTVTAPNTISNLNAQLVQLGQISGRVTAADGGAGLGRVSLRIYDQDGLFIDSVTTDSSGTYTTTGLLASTYTLYAMPIATGSSAAYLPTFYNGKATLLQADPVQVTNVTTVPNINYTLSRGGAISGTVIAADDSTALRDVTVTLYDAGYQRLKSVETTSTGAYLFRGLPTGTYLVQFTPQSFGDSNAYASRFYEEKSDPGSADRVQVTAPATTPNINGLLPRRATVTGQITGNVTDEATNQPLGNVRARARDGNGRIIADTTTDASGTYALTGLNTGRYRVHFERALPNATGFYYSAEQYNNRGTVAEADFVAVTAPNATANINAALALAGQISGLVTAADTGTIAAQVLLYDSAGIRVATTTASTVNEIYKFTQVPPGSYRLYFAPRDLPYIPAYSGNAATLASATSITVNKGQLTENVDITLAQGAQITGQLLAADTGLPLDYHTVELYDVASGQLLDEMRTDSNGRYATFGLANGSYIIRAQAKNSYLAADSPTVTIAAPTERRTVNLQLQRAASILGRIMAASTKQPIGGVFVATTDCGFYRQTDTTNWLGLYMITGLTSGTYTILYETDEYNASTPYITTTATDVAVNAPTELIRHQTLQRGGQISGVISAADTGQGLEDVYVYAYNEATELTRYMRTNEVGAYALRGLPDGQYRLSFSPDNDTPAAAYIREYYSDQSDFTQAQRITIAGANRLAETNISLARGARIAGRITDADTGLPLPEVDVYARDANGFYWGNAESDSDGNFITGGLPSGTYRLYFWPLYFRDEIAGYTYEYYNDQTTLTAGESINVSAPNLIGGYDAALALGGRISGIVTNKAGQPLDDVYINVYDSTDERVTYAYSESDGSYITPGLPTGNYRLSFQYNGFNSCITNTTVSYYNGKRDLASAETILVTAPVTQRDINLTLDITGTVGPTPTPISGAKKIYLPVVSR